MWPACATSTGFSPVCAFEDFADALLLALGRVETWAPGLDSTEAVADEGELAAEGVSGDLERQSGRRPVLVGLGEPGLFPGPRAGRSRERRRCQSWEVKSTTASRTGCTPCCAERYRSADGNARERCIRRRISFDLPGSSARRLAVSLFGQLVGWRRPQRVLCGGSSAFPGTRRGSRSDDYAERAVAPSSLAG